MRVRRKHYTKRGTKIVLLMKTREHYRILYYRLGTTRGIVLSIFSANDEYAETTFQRYVERIEANIAAGKEEGEWL